MSYTAPTYVDTKEQAILALASTIADTDKTLLGDGSVNKALDVLADVLAEHDVSVPQTDAGAILALAQYVGGGGGGGGDFTTAKVTMTNNYDDMAFNVVVPILYEGVMYTYISSGEISGFEFDVVLYKGACILVVLPEDPNDHPVITASTGSITVDEYGSSADITGNGTLTFGN